MQKHILFTTGLLRVQHSNTCMLIFISESLNKKLKNYNAFPFFVTVITMYKAQEPLELVGYCLRGMIYVDIWGRQRLTLDLNILRL